MDGILVNGQRPFSRKITNFMRAAQRLRAILRAVGRFSPLASPYRGVFVAAAALWRLMCPRALAAVGSRRRERPPGWRAAGSTQKKTGDFSEKTRENRRKSTISHNWVITSIRQSAKMRYFSARPLIRFDLMRLHSIENRA